MGGAALGQRVERAAEAALAQQRYAPEIERTYRTHWVSPELSAAKRDRLAERQRRPPTSSPSLH